MALQWLCAGVLAAVVSSAELEPGTAPAPEQWAETEAEFEDMALLQSGAHISMVRSNVTKADEVPFIIPLRRELSPVIRKGKVVSHRASYSGVIHVGHPNPQEFRVVFDTGSAHIVLPSASCHSSACLKHVQYDIMASETGQAVHLDGRPVLPGHVGESVTIGFGTARVTGDFVRDKVCLGPAKQAAALQGPCVEMQAVMATEMSPRPFDQFKFDGIVGLGLPSLALNSNFSLFSHLAGTGNLQFPYFSFFLAEGDDGEESEIAVGGHNSKHLLEPVSWVPTAKPDLGYWQVRILAMYVNGTKLDVCTGGDCHGILDSGTSHLGIPSSTSESLNDLLTRPAGESKDCRRVEAPTVLLELDGFNLTLYPENYMRLLPVPADVLGDANITVSPNAVLQDAAAEEAKLAERENSSEASDGAAAPAVELLCTPKLLPVSWPEPVGPNIFILGEPVLQRYYTVFDWSGQRAGFGLASHLRQPRRDNAAAAAGGSQDHAPASDEIVLLQVVLTVDVKRS